MKFEIRESEFFKTWTGTGVNRQYRILKHKGIEEFHPYELQKFNGKTWEDVRGFRTLREAKAYI